MINDKILPRSDIAVIFFLNFTSLKGKDTGSDKEKGRQSLTLAMLTILRQ